MALRRKEMTELLEQAVSLLIRGDPYQG